MAITVSFQNPKTGEIKPVKLGWSWILFFFATFLGLPLFLRKLTTIGAVCLAASLLNFVLPAMASDEDGRTATSLLTSTLTFGLNIWLAIKGNEMTARNYLDLGWILLHPDSPEAVIARRSWNLPEVSETKFASMHN